VTYRDGAEGTGGDSADAVELLWAAPSEASLEHSDTPEAETTTSDEWDDLRQVLAGDAPGIVDDDEDEDDDDAADDDDAENDELDEPVAVVVDAVAELTERVDEMAADLREERAARERLAGQLDRLAVELDVVLGEALATERQSRQQLEDTLRQVQATLTEAAPAYEGPERRTGEDRRSAGERRRGLPPRPLRARRVADEVEAPAPLAPPDVRDAIDVADEDVVTDVDVVDEAEHPVDETTGAWKSRLHDVAGSVSAWSADDIDRLRVD
jgi:hypothetical protein